MKPVRFAFLLIFLLNQTGNPGHSFGQVTVGQDHNLEAWLMLM